MDAAGRMARWLGAVALAIAVLLPAGASAQQAQALQGIPIPIPQITTDRGGVIVSVPGVLPAIRVPAAIGQPRPAAPPPLAPTLPFPAPTAPAAPAEPPPAFEVPELPATPQPGDALGRVYGVFVGISDYPSNADLQYCADDAARVQQAFVGAGIASPLDTVVLQDHRATRAAVSGAVERFARRMGPNDTLVFFFSGHGNQVPDQDGDERDGQDETILLADGPVLDDELAALLRPGAGRDVVALDSCHSGGFQQDLATLPNTAGFYASREDQLSYVATEHQAGGYLSYHLAEAVSRSQGRPLTMGHLQRELRDGFDRSGATGRQDLTIGVSRSVSYRSVLFSAQPDMPAYVAQR